MENREYTSNQRKKITNQGYSSFLNEEVEKESFDVFYKLINKICSSSFMMVNCV